MRTFRAERACGPLSCGTDMTYKPLTYITPKSIAPKVLRRILLHAYGGKCLYCGWNKEISVLQSHHRSPKDKTGTIPAMCSAVVAGSISIEQLIAEMDKCDVVCPTCHRYLHQQVKKADNSMSKLTSLIKGR